MLVSIIDPNIWCCITNVQTIPVSVRPVIHPTYRLILSEEALYSAQRRWNVIDAKGAGRMSIETNKALVRRYLEVMINGG